MADEDDNKPENTPPTDPPADPPPPPPAPDNDKPEWARELMETVADMQSQIAALTPTPGDNAPVTLPWTHRGGGR